MQVFPALRSSRIRFPYRLFLLRVLLSSVVGVHRRAEAHFSMSSSRYRTREPRLRKSGPSPLTR